MERHIPLQNSLLTIKFNRGPFSPSICHKNIIKLQNCTITRKKTSLQKSENAWRNRNASACTSSQCCTEREYVDYNPPQKAHRSTDWERMGGYTADAKSKNYLEDEDLA